MDENIVRVVAVSVAMVWEHHVGSGRMFDLRIRSGMERITPKAPFGVQADVIWETELITVWPEAIRRAAAANDVGHHVLLTMYGGEEGMHLVQKNRGDTPVPSRNAWGELLDESFNHPMEREAREAGLHVLKYLIPAVTGSLVAPDGTQVNIPDETMFRSIPAISVGLRVP